MPTVDGKAELLLQYSDKHWLDIQALESLPKHKFLEDCTPTEESPSKPEENRCYGRI